MNYFDSEKKLKFATIVPDNVQLYVMIYIAIIKGQNQLNKESGKLHERKYVQNTLSRLIKKPDKIVKRALDVLQNHCTIRKKDKHTIDDLIHATQEMTALRFRIYTRSTSQRYYNLEYDINKDATTIVNLAVFNGNFNTFNPTAKTIHACVCRVCWKTYTNMSRHKCAMMCIRCGQKNCGSDNTLDEPIRCDDCNFYFNSATCFELHKKAKTVSYSLSKCDAVKLCLKCGKAYATQSGKHDCEKSHYCNTCKKKVNAKFHNCTWSPITEATKRKLVEKQSEYKHVFFDLETCVWNDNEEYIQQFANLCCWSTLCELCLTKDPQEECEKCGYTKRGYIKHQAGEPQSIVMDKFLDMLLFDTRFNNATILSHNGARFDTQFVLSRLLSRGIQVEVITRGTSLIILEVPGLVGVRNRIVFKDSYLYLSAPLASLPGMFALGRDLKKGTFPIFYNRESSYNQVIPHLPDLKYYGVKYMNDDARKKLEAWYSENYNNDFSFEFELLSYCQTDVYILHLAIAKFIQMCLSEFSLQPIVHCATLPSVAFFLIKRLYKNEQVAILPENGISRGNQSLIAIQYFKWLEVSNGIRLQYSERGGELAIQVDGHIYKVDAVDHQNRRIIELNGCMIHGCPQEYPHNMPHPLQKLRTYGDVYNETMARIEQIKKATDYEVEIVWEHTIRELLKTDKEMRKFFKETHHLKPLAISDGYYGGRTQPTRIRCTADLAKGESIQNLDVRSLYPYCMARACKFPEGSPKVTTDYDDVEVILPLPFHGFGVVAVLPPRKLKHPVLPYRRACDGRLVFTLCRTCSELTLNQSCPHESPEDRMLYLTVYSGELELAMRHGYRLMRIFESYHWRNWGNVFKDFILPLQKMKQEASGWPKENMTDEEKDAYIDLVFREEQIQLDRDKINLNKPMRAMAKYLSNSAYGKLAQHCDRSTVRFVHPDSDELWDILLDPTVIITNQRLVGEFLMISSRQKEESVVSSPFTNVSYAAIITSHARMILFEAMHKLGNAVIYYDTDSILALAGPGEVILKEDRGDFLGRWASEVPENCVIFDMVSIASKTYSYRMLNNVTGEITEVVKAKGITIDSTSKDVVNFDSMVALAEDFIKGSGTKTLTTSRPQIVRKDGEIFTHQMDKKLRVVMNKLRYLPDYTTLPFGYVDECE